MASDGSRKGARKQRRAQLAGSAAPSDLVSHSLIYCLFGLWRLLELLFACSWQLTQDVAGVTAIALVQKLDGNDEYGERSQVGRAQRAQCLGDGEGVG